jgi:predicted ester cyclase
MKSLARGTSARWTTGRSTYRGELMGIAPTGMVVSVGGIIISRVSGGRIEEEWNNFDALGMMQLSVVTPPGAGWKLIP